MRSLIETPRSRDDVKRRVDSAQIAAVLARRKEMPLAHPIDYQYFNIKRYNDTKDPIFARYTQSFPVPFIDKASDYQLNVERFRLPLSGIPIFIWPDPVTAIYPGTAPATGTYWITLQYNNPPAAPVNFSWPLIYQTPVQYSSSWIGQIRTQPTITDITDGKTYYGIWHILDMLELTYRAAQSAFADLVAAFPASTQALAPANGPLIGFTYQGTNLISFDAPANWNSSLPAPHNDYIRVFMNFDLSQFMSNFRSSLYSQNVDEKLAYEIQLRPTYVTTISGASYISIPQELPTYQQWSTLQSLIFTTGTIPINPESATPTRGADSSNTLFSITDFEILEFTNPADYVTFTQIGPRRYVDLRAALPLQQLDIQVYWEDSFGRFFPVMIDPTQIFTMKILFRHRDVPGA